ncbi:zinc finger MYND domain-containing protein 11-like isoform X2 [Apostichopus japonicus]|uniref:zinc finger MYND domain-containing protein 11-like isoform X2 n=1 Tax=Stichopus japonicus TaxID=307972 RepID=UPI003AB74997
MVKVEARRQADPQVVQHLWEAITLIRNQKQVANKERIQKYMHRQFGTPKVDCMLEIGYAALDGLLVKEISTGKKGIRAGLEQEAFWCVEDTGMESSDSHDWYCFTCHKPGKVQCCSTCHRVYHPQCVSAEESENTEDKEWSCVICESLTQKTFKISRVILFRLLNFVLARMKDKARELHRKLKLETVPNYYHLVYRHVDLGTMIEKVEQKLYTSLAEFEANAQDMIHTSAVYYGVNSDRMRLSQLTLNDCRYDLAEIRLCVDCYLSSNNKVGKDWFCRPCDPIHELAWVHMKGFGYWPAKILCRNEGRVDVRFFGKRHERALVPEEDVKNISTPVKALRTKQSKGWQNAFKEMEEHKRMVAEGIGPLRNEEKPEKEEEVEKKPEKRGIKRKSEQSEAEKFVKKSHSDAGQVNSISTSQEYSRSDNHPSKKSKKKASKEAPAPDTDQSQESPISQDSDVNPGDEEPERKEPKELPKKPHPEKHKHHKSSSGSGSSHKEERGEGKEKTRKRKNSHSDEDDLEAKYRKKLADYKAHQEKEIQSRVEAAVAEAVSTAQKKWETEQSETEAESVAQNEESITEARKEEREKLVEEHTKEMNQLKEKHKEDISQTKKRQWCINCEQEAMYHCCWNTSYCSISCQQIHWHKEHKRLCRRRR